MSAEPIVIIGAGPAGLTAAYALSKSGHRVIVFESDPTYVGGLSRTVQYKEFRFDIGGHRFFSKSSVINELWTEILGANLLKRSRLSRIYFRKQYFSYPIRALETFRKLGLTETIRCIASYVRAKLFPARAPKSVEAWVTNQFGRRLYEMFFKTYTEKVWGMDCRDISADWASQRIKGLSLTGAIRHALQHAMHGSTGAADGKPVIKTLIEEFRYPALGPGMMWDACRDHVVANGGQVLLGHSVTALQHDASNGQWIVTTASESHGEQQWSSAHVISSAPLAEMIPSIKPSFEPSVLKAAQQLGYRDFITIALIVNEREFLADNWLYIHDPGVKVGRIQNFKAWSPALVPVEGKGCLGMEYFCFEGDGLWTSTDAELIALATRELCHLGLAVAEDVTDASVVRQRKAYPVYDADYATHVATIRKGLSQLPTFHAIGRNGMHKYDNQDHAMMTGLLTAENIIAGRDVYDAWQVNEDAEYHEEVSGATGERHVPQRISLRHS